MPLSRSSPPPPVPLSINQSLAIKQRLTYYGDRGNNEPAKRFDKELSDRFRIDTGVEVGVYNPKQEERLTRLKEALPLSSVGLKPSDEYDIVMIDIVWVGELAAHLIDLTPYFNEEEIKEHQPRTINNNTTVDGKLVAIPWFDDFGLLYYRKDLLNAHGFGPPDTWEQLEEMAAKIQQTQRDKGHRDFIGFAWQGAAYEGLTCNALEWIASRGGYDPGTNHISDLQIVVEALDRARVWSQGSDAKGSGRISLGVVDDKEEESLSRFNSGDAAFLRMWSSAFARLKQAKVPFDVAPLPSAKDHKRVGMVGGWQLAVPKYSRHPYVAVEFIRYLTSPEVQSWRALKSTFLPTIDRVANEPEVQKQLSSLYKVRSNPQLTMITRPSSRLGLNYDEASECFRRVVHRALYADSKQQVQQEVSNMAQDPHCQKFLSQHQ